MKTKTMLAAILVEQNKPLVIDKVHLPESLSFGQILVKILYSGICGSQIGEIDGIKGEDKYLPHLLGHEGAGIVLETGAGVKSVSKGDHVVLHWREGIGICSETPVYKWEDKLLNAGWVTTFNEYAIVSENRITSIDKDFPLELAPLLGCAVTTGFGVINNDANVKIGESVVVIGAGGVGLSVVQGAALVSANPIIAVDIFDNKLELAKEFGATHIVNVNKLQYKESRHKKSPDQQNSVQENADQENSKNRLESIILNIVGETGADVVVESTGNVDMIELAYRLSASKGKTILVGVPSKKNKASIYTLPLHFGKILTGSHGGDSLPHKDIERYIRLYQSGKLKLEELITARFKLSEINIAINKIRSGEIAGRCIISMV